MQDIPRPRRQRLQYSMKEYLSATARLMLHAIGRIKLDDSQVQSDIDIVIEMLEMANDARVKEPPNAFE